MKKLSVLLALIVLVCIALSGCAKNSVDAAMEKFKKSIKNLELAVKSGDEKKIDQVADEFEKAGKALEAYEDSMTDAQKLEMAKISLDAYTVLLQVIGGDFTQQLDDSLSGIDDSLDATEDE